MKFNPHEYQEHAIRFVETHPIAAVLMDMGLGKTVIALTALLHLLERGDLYRILVIAPLRVAKYTWPQEIEKWDHLKGLRHSVAVGNAKERAKAFEQDADIYIINRENVPWMIENIPFDFDAIVIDELSSFKNHASKRHRALSKVRPDVKRVIGLTGTPTSNGLTDLFGEIGILDMGKRLGASYERYCNTYFYPYKTNGWVVYSYRPLKGAKEEIFEKISDITISMKAEDYLEMPDLLFSESRVFLSPKEQLLYDDMWETYTADIDVDEVTAANSGALVIKLAQMANGAVYTDHGAVATIHDRKLDALEDIIESMNGKPLLVAYWYKHDLQRIKERLAKMKIKYSMLDDAKSIALWNQGQIPVALVHPQSVGHGLNLQEGGSTICWFSLTWSLECYQQMNARLYRQGQQSSSVVVNHIIADGTIDEDILNALQQKGKMQSALFNAVKARLKNKRQKKTKQENQ